MPEEPLVEGVGKPDLPAEHAVRQVLRQLQNVTHSLHDPGLRQETVMARDFMILAFALSMLGLVSMPKWGSKSPRRLQARGVPLLTTFYHGAPNGSQ